jgi:hypothetical protein
VTDVLQPSAGPAGLLIPPAYCEYAGGPCDQSFAIDGRRARSLFLYPSSPRTIAGTIEAAVQNLQQTATPEEWWTWRDLPIPGQIIFTEICKGMRYSTSIIADVTTLNFNVLFEIGFAIGLGLPVVPIRDTTYLKDNRLFEELGLLDTLGYIDFTNSEILSSKLRDALPVEPLPQASPDLLRQTPLYVVKPPVITDGVIQLFATIKKSGLRYRTYDPVEMPRLSLHEARTQAGRSVGVIAHLLDPNRTGSIVHNAVSAFVGGLALAQQKVVLLLQEGEFAQPIDYRDVVRSYTDPRQIPRLLDRALISVVGQLQTGSFGAAAKRDSVLEELDLGDVAAENEIDGLDAYFVPTGQSSQARQGHARLVIGRKGSGKTAIFYQLRNSLFRGHGHLILDLKPEGHQFTKLRELVLDRLSTGFQEHTMVAFWTYILVVEFARKIGDEYQWARRDPGRFTRYERAMQLYERHDTGIDADFSQRLLREVERIAEALADTKVDQLGPRLTEVMYSGDIPDLVEAVCEYLSEKEAVWLLIDNLDKGWPVKGSTAADILIVRSLLESTRKLQREFDDRGAPLTSLVFLRTDIYEHLVRETPDKGKDTAIRLDWDDPALFEEIVRRRVEASTELRGPLREWWPKICVSHIEAQDTFNYIVDRTLMRPRDLLQFLHRGIDVAINRGHHRIEAEDLSQAEKSYSEDVLLATAYEIQDTHPEYGDVLYSFQGAKRFLSPGDIALILTEAGVADEMVPEAMELLVWFGFLGLSSGQFEDEKFAHDVQFNLRRIMQPIDAGKGAYVVHPAFRAALDIGAE